MKLLGKLVKGACILVGGFVLICILAASCVDDETVEYESIKEKAGETVEEYGEQPEEEYVEPAEEAEYVFTENPSCYNDGYWDHIVGVVKNNTGKDMDYIQISFTLYDANDNVVGTAFANANNVKNGGTWKFDAMITDDGVARFELDEITGW